MRLDINKVVEGERAQTQVIVTLSKRNLLTLLHKVDWPESAKEIQSHDVWVNGTQTEDPLSILLSVQCESDEAHYGKEHRRYAAAGRMHHDTEAFVLEHTANGEDPHD